MSSNPHPTIPLPNRCHRYLGGVMVTFDTPGHKHRGWNHDIVRMKAFVDTYPDIEWSPGTACFVSPTQTGIFWWESASRMTGAAVIPRHRRAIVLAHDTEQS